MVLFTEDYLRLIIRNECSLKCLTIYYELRFNLHEFTIYYLIYNIRITAIIVIKKFFCFNSQFKPRKQVKNNCKTNNWMVHLFVIDMHLLRT